VSLLGDESNKPSEFTALSLLFSSIQMRNQDRYSISETLSSKCAAIIGAK
jgi:hypothetical protein